MVMDVYAMESALLRTQKIMADRGKENCLVQADITRVYVREAALRIERAAQTVATETADDKSAPVIDHLVHRAPIKAIAARRRIAEAITQAGRYNL
jgi:hypothetical protein